jgi:hypothetical protein
MQMSQLAGIHAHWTAATEATGIEDTGPRIGAVAVESHPSNVHLTCEAPLLKAPMVLVPKEAIALQYHDIAGEVETIVVPPVTGGPSVVPSAQAAGSLKALVGPPVAPLQAAIPTDVEISVSEVGHAPEASAQGTRLFTCRGDLWKPGSMRRWRSQVSRLKLLWIKCSRSVK